MAVVDRLFKRFKRKSSQIGVTQADLIFWKPLRLIKLEAGEVTNPYQVHPVVHAAVSHIAHNIAAVPFRIYRATKDGGKEPVENHKLYELFLNPSPLYTAPDLWIATVSYYVLQGEVFWLLERERKEEVPLNIWVLNPESVQVKRDDRGFPVAYLYRAREKEITYQPEQIVHFRRFNPEDPIRGISPLDAAKIEITQDYLASKYNEAFFRNSADPGGLLISDQPLTEEQYKRLQKQWESRHKGFEKAHRFAILEGGIKYQSLGISQKDMQFLEQRRWNREEIAMVLGVPKTILGLQREEGMNYATAKVMERAFWRYTLLPIMRSFEVTLEARLFNFIEKGQYWGEFDVSNVEALQEDIGEKAKVAAILAKMGWPINQINDLLDLGFKPVSWGDTYFVPMNVVPASDYVPQEGKAKSARQQRSFIAFHGGQKILPSVAIAIKREILQKYMAVHSPLEKQFKAKISRYFMEQRVKMLKLVEAEFEGVKNFTKDMDDNLEKLFAEENEILKGVVTPLYEQGMKAGIKKVEEELGMSLYIDLSLPEAAAYMQEKLIKITRINDTVREQIRKSLMQGLAAGETVAQLQDRVRKIYNFASSRSLTIARTESSQAIQGGQFIARKEAEIPYHMWVTALDEHVRESHQRLEGVVVEVGQPFPNGLRFPGDIRGPAGEVINCRCDVISVYEEG